MLSSMTLYRDFVAELVCYRDNVCFACGLGRTISALLPTLMFSNVVLGMR